MAVAALLLGSLLVIAVMLAENDRWALLAAIAGVALLAIGLVSL